MKKRVAFFILDVQGLKGGNGAERFFADLYNIYKAQEDPKFDLFFITDSIENYKEISKFDQKDKNVIILRYARKWFNNKHANKPTIVRKPLRMFILIAAFTELFFKLVRNKINLIHLCLYIKFDYPFVRFIDLLPKFIRPKIVLNMVDCTVPYYYFRDEEAIIRTSAHRFHHEKLFKNVHIDAVYSWYENVKVFLEEHQLIRSKPQIKCITSRFVLNHAGNGHGEKKNLIVFAGRLTDQKRPLMFLNAIHLLSQKNIPEINGWKFRIYGRGYLESDVSNKIAEYDLSNLVELTYNKNMSEVFAESKCFVSPQDFENFPSMAMAEAMINKNAIIARNVGQTSLFVKDGINGLLIHPDSEEGLCTALEDYIINNDKYRSFGEESLKLMQTIHTPENFIVQIDDFWASVLN